MKLAQFVLVVAVAFGSSGLFADHHENTLYERLGGKKAITAVVDDFVANCAADTRINKFFAKTAKDKGRMSRFKANLVDQICEAAKGPCKYKGMNMKNAHAGMGVQGEHFDALVEDLVKSLDKFKVAEADKATLLSVLGPMKKDIVETKRGVASQQ
jgi:hemoglobin